MKYQIGDKVIIDKLFVNVPHGHWEKCDDTIVTVIKSQTTASLGDGYVLETKEGNRLPVYYWETDIVRRVNEEQEK